MRKTMHPLTRLGYLAAACALLVTTFAIIGPRTVRAVTATLIRDVDNPARHPFAGICGFASSSTNTVQCTMPVPAGEEVVIQTAWVNAFAASTNTRILTTVQTFNASTGISPLESASGTNNAFG